MAAFSINTQKLRWAEQEFRKISTEGNRTTIWDESSIVNHHHIELISDADLDGQQKIYWQEPRSDHLTWEIEKIIQHIIIDQNQTDDSSNDIPDEEEMHNRYANFHKKVNDLIQAGVALNKDQLQQIAFECRVPLKK